MSLRERSKLSILVLVLISLLVSVRAQENLHTCTSNGNYTSNSTYSANLNALLNSLSLNMSDNGFYSSSVGQNQDRVNAFALCRADQTLDQCRTCVRAAAGEILQSCPNQKQAVLWYENCTLLYSNDSIHRTSDRGWVLQNVYNVSIGNVYFREDLNRLLLDLRVQAASGNSELKVGAGNGSTADSESHTIYALLQCTPDLSSEVCRKCLADRGDNILRRLDLTRGMRMLSPNCNIRYELYPFYNETRLRELRVLPPLPPSPPPSLPPSPAGRNDDNTRAKKDHNTTKLVVTIVVPVGVCLMLAACAVIFVRKRIKQRSQEITESELCTDEISTVESLLYDLGKIRAATNDFDHANKLGQGGFGAVYRGKLQNDEEIAVKRLSKNSGQGNTEFKNEVLLVARLQHRNLVRLLGFSLEGTERLLVYEFVQNASLDKFIFDPTKRSHLDWDTRYKIIGGVGRGLLYLHEDSRLRIIHRDLKASNVLLDGDMNPKIADFGMARLFRQDETQGNTSKIVGTYGYMSPEYAMHGQFSIKSDVFSFGVLILEIISGQRNNCILRGENVEDLLTLTWENWQEGTAADMIDPLLRNSRGSLSEMLRCIHIGLLCVQENPANRPTMITIVLMLNSSTMTLPVPLAPAFYMASRFGPQVPISREYDSKTSKFEGSSQNHMSVTELYPR